MLQIRPIFQRAQQRFRSFSLATRNAYDFTRGKANAGLPLFTRLGLFSAGLNRGIQNSASFGAETKNTFGGLHDAVDTMVRNYSTAVNKWNLIHDIAMAPA